MFVILEVSRRQVDNVDGFCSHCNTNFEAIGCFYLFCPCQGVRLSLTEEHIQRGIEKKELDELRRNYKKEKKLHCH